jgi:hypothetical protein
MWAWGVRSGDVRPTTSVPERGTLALFGAGLLALLRLRRRRARNALPLQPQSTIHTSERPALVL